MATGHALTHEASILAEIGKEKRNYSMLKCLEAHSREIYEEPDKDVELLEYKEEYEFLLSKNNLCDSYSRYIFFKEKAAEADERITQLSFKLAAFVANQFRSNQESNTLSMRLNCKY